MMEEQHERQTQRRDTVRTVRGIALIGVVILALVFVITNNDSVEVSLIFTDVDIPLVWALVAALILGFVVGWLTKSFRNRD